MTRLSGPGSLLDRRSIRFPFVRLIIVTVLLGVGIALISDAILLFHSVRRDIQRSLTAAANAAGMASSAAVAFGDAAAAKDVLRMFEAYPEIEAAAVYPNQGPRLASYGHDELLPATAGDIRPATEISALSSTAVAHMPIVLDDLVIGTVYVRARLDAYWQTYVTTIAMTIFVGLTAGALALMLAMRLLERIILPVRLLAEVARDARLRQDFRPRPIPTADDEVGDMVKNFNSLLEEVDASRQSLQIYQSELERLVVERTSELSAAKEAAEQANLAKSRFLAAASHDLRQPIQAMQLFQDTLSRTELSGEQRRIASYLAQSTHSLAEILNVLLDVSKLDGGMVAPCPEAISARTLLGNLAAEFEPLALAKGLRFKLCFPGRDLTLFTDVKLLYSLMRNLIDNAIKYTERGGVLVGIRRRGRRVLLQVWDTGIGVAPEHLHAIFDEYFQVSNPQRDSSRGLGLGLAIVKRVAAILDGRVACRSRLHRGSVFELSLPLGQPQYLAEEACPADECPSARPLAGVRVVVIDDDPMAAKATALALGACGMQVTTFRSGESALADDVIAATDFYVVDYRLPGMTGTGFLDALQKRVPHPVKATLLTGERPAAPGFGAWPALFKPVDLEALVAEIRKQLFGREDADQDLAKG